MSIYLEATKPRRLFSRGLQFHVITPGLARCCMFSNFARWKNYPKAAVRVCGIIRQHEDNDCENVTSLYTAVVLELLWMEIRLVLLLTGSENGDVHFWKAKNIRTASRAAVT